MKTVNRALPDFGAVELPLSWACDTISTKANLMTVTKKRPSLWCDDTSGFWPGRGADFWSVKIAGVRKRVVEVEADSVLPAGGLLTQKRYAGNADELHKLFERYSSDFWMRDAKAANCSG